LGNSTCSAKAVLFQHWHQLLRFCVNLVLRPVWHCAEGLYCFTTVVIHTCWFCTTVTTCSMNHTQLMQAQRAAALPPRHCAAA
jgi:hypothetical protein